MYIHTVTSESIQTAWRVFIVPNRLNYLLYLIQYTKRTNWTCDLLCMHVWKNLKSIICISIQTSCSCACCVAAMTAGGLLGCDLHTWIFFPLRPCRSLQTLSAWLWIVCRQYFYGVILAGTLKDIICPKANPGSSWLCAPGHSDTEWRIFSLDRVCVQVSARIILYLALFNLCHVACQS